MIILKLILLAIICFILINMGYLAGCVQTKCEEVERNNKRIMELCDETIERLDRVIDMMKK